MFEVNHDIITLFKLKVFLKIKTKDQSQQKNKLKSHSSIYNQMNKYKALPNNLISTRNCFFFLQFKTLYFFSDLNKLRGSTKPHIKN